MTGRTARWLVAAVIGGALLLAGGLVILSSGAAAGTPRLDPSARQCECSSLVILSLCRVRGCDLRANVEDTVVDAVVVNTAVRLPSGRIVSDLQSARPRTVDPSAGRIEWPEVPR